MDLRAFTGVLSVKGKEQFKVLLEQAGIQDNDHLSGGQLEKIVADDDERVWEFHIHFESMIPASLRNLMEGSIRDAFRSIAAAKIFITADSYDDKDIIDYLEYALTEEIGRASSRDKENNTKE